MATCSFHRMQLFNIFHLLSQAKVGKNEHCLTCFPHLPKSSNLRQGLPKPKLLTSHAISSSVPICSISWRILKEDCCGSQAGIVDAWFKKNSHGCTGTRGSYAKKSCPQPFPQWHCSITYNIFGFKMCHCTIEKVVFPMGRSNAGTYNPIKNTCNRLSRSYWHRKFHQENSGTLTIGLPLEL